MCVCVVWRGIIHGVQTFILKNWSSSPNKTCKYKTADRKHLLVAIGFFYIYIYINISSQWSLFYELEC